MVDDISQHPGAGQTTFVPVTQQERDARKQHRGAVVWFTGLSGAGKSTLANAVERVLFDRGYQVLVLDGDIVRTGLSADLGFSMDDRVENIRRIGEVAALFAEAGTIAITAFISPYAAGRHRARQRVMEMNVDTPFVEVHVDAPLALCEARDPKGLYRRARAGELKEFTGVSAPYEPPATADLVLKTGEYDVEACVGQLLAVLLPAVMRR